MDLNEKVNIRIFDKDLIFIGEVDIYESMIFTKKWHTYGEFEIHLDHVNPLFFKNGNYIMLNTDPYRSGIILYEKDDLDGIEKDSRGGCVVKGFTLGYLLTARTTKPVTTSDGYRTWNSTCCEDIMYDLVKEHFVNPEDSERVFQGMVLGENKHRGEKVTFQTRFKVVKDELTVLSEQSGLGFRVKMDVYEKQFIFEVVEGIDRRYSDENENAYVFSKENEKVERRTYERSSINTSNVAYVGGQGEGAEREIVEINAEKSGRDRWEMFVDARDIERGLKEALKDRGTQKLLEASELESFIFETNNEDYGKLWDLGDMATFFDRGKDVVQDNRIVEIRETYEYGSGVVIEPTFGKPLKTIKDYLKQKTIDNPNERTGIQKEFDHINAQKMIRVTVESTNGILFKNNLINTTLTCRVFSWDKEITETLPSSAFTWTRVSNNPESDAYWNAEYGRAVKTVHITNDDFYERAVYTCDVEIPE